MGDLAHLFGFDWVTYFNNVGADISENWLLYLSIPFVSALIGYVTKVVAIKMMFQPLDFLGIKPFFGWQGIVPRKAEKMATMAVDTMTAQLLSVKEVFGRIDPAKVAFELETPLLSMMEEITREVVIQQQPGLWEVLPNFVREKLIKRVQNEAPKVIKEVMSDLRQNIESVFDLKHMVVSNLVKDRELLNRIFLETGKEEFKFIGNSGLYFGFLLGIIQMICWVLFKQPWILPVFGFVVGFATDWAALNLLFVPREPRRILGLKVQGLFLRRQKEVARDYAALIATQIVTPKNIWAAVLNGPLSDRLFQLVEKHIRQSVDEQAGAMRPLLAMAIGTERYQSIKQSIAERIMQRLPDTLKYIEQYAEEAMDVRQTLISRMQELSPAEFENMLRPVFKEDEWILITVGAVLGLLCGELQLFLMTH